MIADSGHLTELTPGCWFTKQSFDLILVNLIFNEINACIWSVVYVRNAEVISHPAAKLKKLSFVDTWKMKNAGDFKGFPADPWLLHSSWFRIRWSRLNFPGVHCINCTRIVSSFRNLFIAGFFFSKDSEKPLTYQIHYKTAGGLYTVVSYGDKNHVETVLPQGQKDDFKFEFSVTIKDKLFAETTVQLPSIRVSLWYCFTLKFPWFTHFFVEASLRAKVLLSCLVQLYMWMKTHIHNSVLRLALKWKLKCIRKFVSSGATGSMSRNEWLSRMLSKHSSVLPHGFHSFSN